MAGPAGPAGPYGPAGAQGLTGQKGVRGPTLVGPAGPAGLAGAQGARGESGQRGATGSTMAGVPGSAGPAGPAGEQGAPGAMGFQGPTGLQGQTGLVEGWSLLREVQFDLNEVTIRSDEMYKISETATYMQQNPSISRLAIDTWTAEDPNTTDQYIRRLGQRRVDAVRDALINAGLPAYKIQPMGGIRQTQIQCNEDLVECRRVGMLVNSANFN